MLGINKENKKDGKKDSGNKETKNKKKKNNLSNGKLIEVIKTIRD